MLLKLTVLQKDGSSEVCLYNPRYITCISPVHGGVRWPDYTYTTVPDGARSFVEFVYNRTTVGYFVAESLEGIGAMMEPEKEGRETQIGKQNAKQQQLIRDLYHFFWREEDGSTVIRLTPELKNRILDFIEEPLPISPTDTSPRTPALKVRIDDE